MTCSTKLKMTSELFIVTTFMTGHYDHRVDHVTVTGHENWSRDHKKIRSEWSQTVVITKNHHLGVTTGS